MPYSIGESCRFARAFIIRFADSLCLGRRQRRSARPLIREERNTEHLGRRGARELDYAADRVRGHLSDPLDDEARPACRDTHAR